MTLLIAVRVAAATAIAPVFGTTRIPALVRIGITAAVSVLLVIALPGPVRPPTSLLEFVVASSAEALLGAAFAAGFIAAHGAAEFAGRALDTQIGFGAAAILNPTTQTFSPLLGNLFSLLVVAAFLAADGHLLLIRALALSTTTTPPGTFLGDFDWPVLLQQSGLSFSFGLALAAPVLFTLMLSDLAMAVFARSMPQLNVLVLGFAVKIVLGLAGLAVSVRFLEGLTNRLFVETFGYWQRLAD